MLVYVCMWLDVHEVRNGERDCEVRGEEEKRGPVDRSMSP